MAALSSLTDAFTADPDPALWDLTGTGSVSYLAGVGLVQTGDRTLHSVALYDFDSATVRVDVSGGTTWWSFTVEQPESEALPWPDNRAMFLNIQPGIARLDAWFQGYYDATWDPGAPPTNFWPTYGGVKQVTYDAETMRYLRMTNTAVDGQLVATFAASPDGSTWATVFEFTATLDDTYPFRAHLGGSSAYAVLADFNVAIEGTDMANAAYNAFKEGLLNAEYDLNTAAIKVALVRGYTFDATHATVADAVAAGAVLNGTSAALASPSITGGTFDADDTTIATTANANNHSLLVFQASAVTGGADVAQNAQKLIAYFDTGTGLPVVPGTGFVTVSWANTTNRILKVG